MRPFLACFFCTVAGLLCVPLAIYPTFEGTKIEAGRWISDCLTIKLGFARKVSHSKIIITGGSNALFGFSARQLEDELQMPAVNLAMHAGLGLDYILYTTKKVTKKDDLVVLALEYDLYGDEKTTYAKDFQILAADQQYLRDLPFMRRWAFLSSVSPDNWQRLTMARIHPEPPTKMGYQASNLNDRGDETSNSAMTGTMAEQAARRAHLSRIAPTRLRLSPTAVRRILRFGEDVKQRGAHLVVTYPNIIENALGEKLNSRFFTDLQSILQKNDIDVVSRPGDFAFDSSVAFDTMYHQTLTGQKICTHKLATLLRARGFVPLQDRATLPVSAKTNDVSGSQFR